MELFDIAYRRLNTQNRIDTKSKKSFFTSDLSTNEYLLTRQAGCEPIALVMGTSFYKVGFFGYFRGYRSKTGEVAALTDAQITSRELAISRMQSEAVMLGAHGIIGVRIHRKNKGWNTGIVEFTAMGTAIRIPNHPSTEKPFTSNLSGQEFWQLRQAGYWPVGLVFGACAYYVHSDRTTRTLMNPTIWGILFGRSWRNQEMTQFTQGLQDARELAVMRLTAEISQLDATGVIGIQIDRREEVINYQPLPPVIYFMQLFMLGCFLSLVLGLITNNYNFAILLGIGLFITSFIVIWFYVFFVSLSRKLIGPFRDILTSFIVIGTAIVEEKTPPKNPISQTMIFYPLSQP